MLVYRHKITYRVSLEEIIRIMDTGNLSGCKQFTRIDCHGMILNKDEISFGYIVDRNGEKMLYLGGGNSTGRGIVNTHFEYTL